MKVLFILKESLRLSKKYYGSKKRKAFLPRKSKGKVTLMTFTAFVIFRNEAPRVNWINFLPGKDKKGPSRGRKETTKAKSTFVPTVRLQ